MSLSAGTSVGKPRIFIDYVSYLRSQGAITGYTGSPDLWDMNPAKVTPVTNATNHIVIFDDGDELSNFLGTANYFAVLGHNSEGGHYRVARTTNQEYFNYSQSEYAPIGAAYDKPGYKIDTFTVEGSDNAYAARFTNATISNPLVGSFSVGRYFDFNNAVDLDVSYSLSHDGIKTKRTIGGRDITNINYHSQPLWGDRKPWTSGETYKYTGANGRRSWKVSFSYIDHDNALPINMNEDFMLDTDLGTSGSGIAHGTENIVSHFLSLTLNGSLKFIFQPDVNLDQFAICRLSKPQTTFKQVAHKTYDASFTFVETY